MIPPRILGTMLFSAALLLGNGCRMTMEPPSPSPAKTKFRRFFSWNATNKEEDFRKFAEAGVTDILVGSKKQYDLARKYGMTPYWKCFTPAGPHRQVMSPEEEKHYAYINGRDLDPKLPRPERMKIIHRRRIEKQHRYGGEMIAEIDTLNNQQIPCFISDEGLELSRKKLDSILKTAPAGVGGTCLDYIGYMNHHGCRCQGCLTKYRQYLADRKLADTPENKTAFYREKLVAYYNDVIDYIKSKRPDFKIIVHIYPDFQNDHLYGNRTKADCCGQTVSWYFKWDERKIRKYTDFVVNRARDYHPSAEGMPFIGLCSDKTGSVGYKTPEDVERELKAILAAGGDTLMVCDGRPIIEKGYFEVFRKYCGGK